MTKGIFIAIKVESILNMLTIKVVMISYVLTKKEYYDNFYDNATEEALTNKLTLKYLYEKWHDDTNPQNLILLNSLGKLANKRMLILGNGISSKELYFLKLGAKIVYTDLSIKAVNFMKDILFLSELRIYENNIEFHAVDALHLPFPDSSFDIIYGDAFVHHIEDLNQFFSEVYRCLKKDSICRFHDPAYSPIWQFMKKTFLKPLQLYTHKKRGISPADLKFTKRGGFRKDELIELMNKYEFKKLVFVRSSFCLQLYTRGIGKLLGWDHYLIKNNTPFVKVMKWLDVNLEKKSNLMRNNLLKLVWGFNK